MSDLSKCDRLALEAVAKLVLERCPDPIVNPEMLADEAKRYRIAFDQGRRSVANDIAIAVKQQEQ